MNRRQFNLMLAASLIAGASLSAIAKPIADKRTRNHTNAKLPIIKPRALKRGDLVGLIAPSGATDDAFVQQRVKNLENFGLRVKVSKNILAARGNAAGTPAQRVEDLHAMFLDREVKAIWAVRGGSGASQMLPLIDYSLIRNNPKILVGYSDITALHLAILRHSGLVTFHGPVASAAFTDYTATQLEAVLMHPRDETTIYMAQENANRAAQSPEYQMRTLREGIAEGRLIGGNLSVLAALIGTPYAAEIRDTIVFLEDINEAPYRIDRMLTQLNQSQSISSAAGIMLGVFRRSTAPADEASLTLEQTIDDHFSKLDIPAVYGYSFGHIPTQFTIPLGIRARLDTPAETLTLLEAAVV
jgi:muramoyltetrapeptide carboxypeptidase